MPCRRHITSIARSAKKCAALKPDFYELFVKNFGAGFASGKHDVEAELAKGAATADEMLAKVFGHKEDGK